MKVEFSNLRSEYFTVETSKGNLLPWRRDFRFKTSEYKKKNRSESEQFTGETPNRSKKHLKGQNFCERTENLSFHR